MASDRLWTDDEHLTDLLVGVSFGEELEHFVLAIGQDVRRALLPALKRFEVGGREIREDVGVQKELAAQRSAARAASTRSVPACGLAT